MSVDTGPPLQPPQLSPDGKYVWDGNQWQPIAGIAEPVHKGVFAAWNSIQVEPSDPVEEAAPPVPVQAQAPVQVQARMQVRTPVEAPPEMDYSYSVDDPGVVPLWQQPTKSAKTKYLYVGAGLVILVMAVILLNSFNFAQYLPWSNAGSPSTYTPPLQSPSPTPTLDQTRSDFGRADRFLNGSLVPAMAGVNDTLLPMLTCNGTMSNSCFDAINAAEPPLKKVLTVIDHGTYPLCIAAPVKILRSDFANMESAVQLALKGYRENQRGEVATAVSQFQKYNQALGPDVGAVVKAQNTLCSPDPEGP